MLPIVLANLADLLTFLCAASVLPITAEANPLARFVFINFGLAGMVAFKAIGVAVLGGLLAVARLRSTRTFITGVAVAFATFGALANTASVVLTR